MKERAQRALFVVIIAMGVILPWLVILIYGVTSGMPMDAAFRKVIQALPLLPVTVVLLTAWWAIPFVVFAFLWYRLATAEWAPLRRNLLLILLGIPVAISSMAAAESVIAAVYLLLFLVYAMVAVPSWGLRSGIGRIVLGLFGFLALVGFTLLSFVLGIAAGTGDLRQHIATPFGVLYVMTVALFIGYLFAKPIDLLVMRGEPMPENADRPGPSAWLIGGNALACGLGFIGVMVLYSTLMGDVVTRHEIGQALLDRPMVLPMSAMTIGVVLGLAVYLVSFAMLRKGKYRHDIPLLVVALAILPGLLTGIAPGLLGERAVLRVLGNDHFSMYSDYDTGYVYSIAISPDGSRIAAELSERLVIWDIPSGKALVDIRSGISEIWVGENSIVWSPDGSQVSAPAPGGKIIILDSHSGRRLHSLGQTDHNYFTGAAFSRDGTRLVAARLSGRIFRYELKRGEPDGRWESPVPTRRLTAIALHPDSRWLAVTGVSLSGINPMGGFVAVLDTLDGETVFAIDNFEQVADQLSFSPDGSLLLLSGTDYPPRLIDTSTGRPATELRHHCAAPTEAHQISRFYAGFLDQRTVAMGCGGTAQVCDTSRGDCRVLFDLQLSAVSGVAPHPNGRHVAFVEDEGSITLWDAQTAEPWRSYRLP